MSTSGDRARRQAITDGRDGPSSIIVAGAVGFPSIRGSPDTPMTQDRLRPPARHDPTEGWAGSGRHFGLANVLGSTSARALNSMPSTSTYLLPSRRLCDFVATLMPPNSL